MIKLPEGSPGQNGMEVAPAGLTGTPIREKSVGLCKSAASHIFDLVVADSGTSELLNQRFG